MWTNILSHMLEKLFNQQAPRSMWTRGFQSFTLESAAVKSRTDARQAQMISASLSIKPHSTEPPRSKTLLITLSVFIKKDLDQTAGILIICHILSWSHCMFYTLFFIQVRKRAGIVLDGNTYHDTELLSYSYSMHQAPWYCYPCKYHVNTTVSEFQYHVRYIKPIYISAVKRWIAYKINVFLHNICVFCVYVYNHSHTAYIFEILTCIYIFIFLY